MPLGYSGLERWLVSPTAPSVVLVVFDYETGSGRLKKLNRRLAGASHSLSDAFGMDVRRPHGVAQRVSSVIGASASVTADVGTVATGLSASGM